MGETKNQKVTQEDNMTNSDVLVEDNMDNDKLAALKAKMAAKNEASQEVSEDEEGLDPERSLNIGIIGSGQAGSRLAESFYKLGYDAVVINTASQDLKHIKIPESNKLLLEFSFGGASKELAIGHEAALVNKEAINQLVQDNLEDSHVLLLTTSLGGGSGAGSAEVVVDILSQMDRPVLVMAVLPMANEDAQTKQNALITLSKLTKAAQSEQIAGLVVVDNAKIESIYTDVSQLNFYSVANNAVIKPLDAFNIFSTQPSPVKALDPMEFSKILTDGRGLITYGQMKVSNYTDDVAIAEAVIENLNGNLLSGGFDLTQARYVGVIMVAPKKVWDQVPAGSVNYAMSMINDICKNPNDVFKGIYTTESDDDFILVYSMFSGMGPPSDRIEQLKTETKNLKEQTQAKDEARVKTLKIDMGVDEAISDADKIRNKVKAKNSAFGKLMNRGVKDRRK